VSRTKKQPAHRFPAPWRVDETEAGRFVVRDANGRALAHVYAENENSMRGEDLTPTEAVTLAEAIAKLPTISEAKRKRTVHVVPHKQGGWAIRREGTTRATSIHRTLEQAKKAAQVIAQQEGVEIVVETTGEARFSCFVFGTAWSLPPKSRKIELRQDHLKGVARMMSSRLIAASLVILAVVMTTGATFADNDDMEDAQEKAALANAKLTLAEAIAASTNMFPGGTVLGAAVDTENGVPSYVIDVEKDGMHRVLVDIRSGTVQAAGSEADNADSGDEDEDEDEDEGED
jgi:uncharacterized protein DUF2188/peptidase YpeB-like protein